MTILIKKNESTITLRRITVIIVDQSDGNTLETGQTNFNIEVSKAGGTQTTGTGTWGEVGEGEYYYQFGTTEVNTFGKLTARFNKTGMREFKGEAQVVGFDPYQTLPTQSEINDLQSDINDMKGTGFVKANHSLVKTQSNINALNDPSQTDISTSVWGQASKIVTGVPANVATQTDLNALNDPTSSAINAVITTAHGAGSYSGTSSTVINSIVNAHHEDTQSLINNLDGDIASLNDLSQTEVNAQVDTALSDIRLNELISQSISNVKPAKVSFMDLILNSNTDQNFSQATDSLEALRDNQGGGGATPTSIWNFSPRTITATPQTDLNEHNQTQTLINQLVDATPSEVNATITVAHGAGAYTTATGFTTQTDINAHESNMQSYINAKHGDTQSLINNLDADIQALNDLSQTQVNAQVDTALSDIRLDELINQSYSNVKPAKESFIDLIMNSNTDQNFLQSTDSLEAIRNNQSAGGGATPTSIWNFSPRVLTANTNLNDPTPSVINAVITTAHGAGAYNTSGGASTTDINSIVNAQGLETQSLINALNDISTNDVQSIINTLNDLSTSEVQSIVNAEGNEVQSLINALNDPTSSAINAVITTAHGAGSYVGSGGQTVINKLDAIQTDVNGIQGTGFVKANHSLVKTQSNINSLNDPTSSAINAVITTAHGAGSYVGAGASQTIVNKLDAIQTDINASQGTGFVKDTHSLKNIQSGINALNDPTSSAINAVITTAHGAGAYNTSGGASTTDINSIVNAQGLETQSLINALNDISTNDVQSIINNLNDLSTSEVQSIVNAQGLEVQSLINALNDVSTSQIQSIVNGLDDITTTQVQSIVNAQGLEVQSLINALNDLSTLEVQSIVNGLNDVSTSQIQSIVNAEGSEVQSLINALNDLSTSQVQSIINVHESNVQSDLNAMNTKLVRIEGQNGLYLVAKYTYNTSEINTKIEYWQYASQTDMNNHQTINNIDKWQLDVTLTGQLADTIKFGEHA